MVEQEVEGTELLTQQVVQAPLIQVEVEVLKDPTQVEVEESVDLA